jgi:cation diffusion facilitator CzcD-associated flavoprotein CzcO
MFTLGYPFRPWTNQRAIAPGNEILQYVKDTAAEFGIDKKIRFNHKVLGADWSEADARWTVQVENTATGEKKAITTGFLLFASGYYSYSEGYYPKLNGADSFKGPILKPQFWPKDLDYKGKRIVVIGSGATAATVVPAMATSGAGHVTMLQRTPSYFVAQPSVDPVATFVRSLLPVGIAHHFLRIRNQLRQNLLVLISSFFPNAVKWGLRKAAMRHLPKDFQFDPHFTPPYNPWEQRLCMVPDGDFFASIKSGQADIVTGHIDTILPNSIKLKDGQEIKADIIVQATGLKVQLFGGAKMTINGKETDVSQRFIYKGQMLDGVPNASLMFGYVDASWTLGADLCSRYVVKLLDHMKKNNYAVARPHCAHNDLEPSSLMNLKSGYVERAKHLFPKSSNSYPWRARQSSFWDWISFPFTDIKQDMEFVPAATKA